MSHPLTLAFGADNRIKLLGLVFGRALGYAIVRIQEDVEKENSYVSITNLLRDLGLQTLSRIGEIESTLKQMGHQFYQEFDRLSEEDKIEVFRVSFHILNDFHDSEDWLIFSKVDGETLRSVFREEMMAIEKCRGLLGYTNTEGVIRNEVQTGGSSPEY